MKEKLIKYNESQFQKQVIDLAHYHRWIVAHFRPSWDKSGKKCRTAVQADGAGFPDLCMVKEGRLVFAELKSDTGEVSKDQHKWLIALKGSTKCEVYVWYPKDWDEVCMVLAK